jgi:hypothetical protein
MKGSLCLVLNTRWIKMDDKDWDMGGSFRDLFRAFSACVDKGDQPGALPQAFAFRAFGALFVLAMTMQSSLEFLD